MNDSTHGKSWHVAGWMLLECCGGKTRPATSVRFGQWTCCYHDCTVVEADALHMIVILWRRCVGELYHITAKFGITFRESTL